MYTSNLCSDGRVGRMLVRILAATNRAACVLRQDTLPPIASLHPGVNGWPVRAELVVVFDESYMRRNGSN